MRRRPGAGIRIVTHCARCGMERGRYAMRDVLTMLPVDSIRTRHELSVCSECDRKHAATPTWLEAEALAVDAADPLACMRFFELQRHDARLLQRTARYFLGPTATDAFLAELEARRAEAETSDEDEWDGYEDWRERSRRREWSDLYGDEHEEEVPF